VYLSPQDRKQFGGYEGSLVGELQEYLAEHARRERYELLSPPRVLVTTDEDLAVGEFGIATRVVAAETKGTEPSAPVAPVAAPAELPAQTMVYRVPVVEPAPEPEPEPEPERVSVRFGGRDHVITGERVVLGRSRECELRVADLNVSRQHAEIRREDGAYWIVDLGSMNGTLVNGKHVERRLLDDGDRITLGSTDIVFTRHQPVP
jgi:hypothetical protein